MVSRRLRMYQAGSPLGRSCWRQRQPAPVLPLTGFCLGSTVFMAAPSCQHAIAVPRPIAAMYWESWPQLPLLRQVLLAGWLAAATPRRRRTCTAQQPTAALGAPAATCIATLVAPPVSCLLSCAPCAGAATDEEDTASEDEEKAAGWGQEDTYIVDCPCGVTFDDGHMMIECENCKVWAHTECLQMQMVGARVVPLVLGVPVPWLLSRALLCSWSGFALSSRQMTCAHRHVPVMHPAHQHVGVAYQGERDSNEARASAGRLVQLLTAGLCALLPTGPPA
jgi:hypothetical protein